MIWANLLALPFVILPALVLAWRRLDALAAITLIVLLTVLVMAPTSIDGPSTVAHLANHNRIGGALDAIVCLWALCAPRSAARAPRLAKALMMGVVLLILLYLKVTFFAFAVATALVGCVTARGAGGLPA